MKLIMVVTLILSCRSIETQDNPPELEQEEKNIASQEKKGGDNHEGLPKDEFKSYLSTPSFSLNDANARFYMNVPYGDFDRTRLDLFKASGEEPGPLFIYIHGGGFVKGDKDRSYGSSYFQGLINALLDQNISVAMINYRFVERDDQEGLIKPLGDVKRALQFLRYNATKFNLNKEKVVLMGSSAGAGAAMWLGLKDDMSDPSAQDMVLRESTRVSGILCTSTQASYDVFIWASDIFEEYLSEGFSYAEVESMISAARIRNYYGVSTDDALNSEEIQIYRKEVDFAGYVSSDDPVIYVANKSVPYKIPENSSELYHHPLHAKWLKDKCDAVGLKSHFYIPDMNIDSREGLNTQEFIIGILKGS
ncbi:alpha/beta hydrolase [Marinoscillum sp. MHG1-6]|uniref:alpha/beta hydrolase n=1 Tax=Marinoscillum sp. MHG1-6 TaxID=2959627 RepID=UPI0021584692|nr:alpha/beta hydrolase [Marinoscillum sp. MHG1-6]